MSRDKYLKQLPLLTVIETIAALNRRTGQADLLPTLLAFHAFHKYTNLGRIIQYPLNEARRQGAISVALQYRLRGTDTVYAALSAALGFSLLTADTDFAAVPQAVILLSQQ